MLDKLTIVIPSFGRHKYLKKNINYWKDSVAKVIILDGTAESIDIHDINLFKNIKYFHHPDKSLFERLGLCADLIDTDYAILCCDDEIYLENGLVACIEELEKNKEISCAMGRVLCFRYRDNKKRLVGFSGYDQFKNYFLDNDNPLERLKMHMSDTKGRPTMYSVTRSLYLKEILKLVSNSEQFPCQQTYELQSDISLAYYGKIKFVENLTWLRNFDEQPLWPRGKQYFEKWYLDDNSKSQIDMFLNLTSSSLFSINKTYSVEVLSKTIDDLLNSYSKKNIISLKTFRKMWSNKLAPKLIEISKKIISDKLIYYLKKNLYSELDIFDAAEKLGKNGVKYKRLEFEKAVRILNE